MIIELLTIYFSIVPLTVESAYSSDNGSMLLGIHGDRLFNSVGMNITRRRVGALGVAYELDGHSVLKAVNVRLSIHPASGDNQPIPDGTDGTPIMGLSPNQGGARSMFRLCQGTISGMPVAFDGEIGDERVLWASAFYRMPSGRVLDESGHMLIRRLNAVIWVRWTGPLADGIELAQSLDELIKNDISIAPCGTFDSRPQIKAKEFPASVQPRSLVKAVLEADGFPARDDVEFAVVRWWNGQVISEPQEDKSLFVRIPTAYDLVGHEKVEQAAKLTPPDATVPTELILIAADAMNVFVTQKIEVNVVLDQTE